MDIFTFASNSYNFEGGEVCQSFVFQYGLEPTLIQWILIGVEAIQENVVTLSMNVQTLSQNL